MSNRLARRHVKSPGEYGRNTVSHAIAHTPRGGGVKGEYDPQRLHTPPGRGVGKRASPTTFRPYSPGPYKLFARARPPITQEVRPSGAKHTPWTATLLLTRRLPPWGWGVSRWTANTPDRRSSTPNRYEVCRSTTTPRAAFAVLHGTYCPHASSGAAVSVRVVCADSERPTIHRCPKCRSVVLSTLSGRVWCLRCGVVMRPVTEGRRAMKDEVERMAAIPPGKREMPGNQDYQAFRRRSNRDEGTP